MIDLKYFSTRRRYQRQCEALFLLKLRLLQHAEDSRRWWNYHVENIHQKGLGAIGLYTEAKSWMHKARALTILIAPKLSYVDHLYTHNKCATDVAIMPKVSTLALKDLPKQSSELSVSGSYEDFLVFFIKLVQLNITLCEAHEKEFRFLDSYNQWHSLRDYYNVLVIEALGLIPDEHPLSKELLDILLLREHEPLSSNAGERSYGHLGAVWRHPDISLHMKQEVDLRMRRIILEELQGDREPRREWEDALQCYFAHIRISCTHYDVSLLADQVHFLTSYPVVALFPSMVVKPMLECLGTNDLYRDAQKEIINHVIRKKRIADTLFVEGEERNIKLTTKEMLLYLHSHPVVGSDPFLKREIVTCLNRLPGDWQKEAATYTRQHLRSGGTSETM